jgi:hypothetical protein
VEARIVELRAKGNGILKSLHPVSTAGSSLARFRAGKQTGIGFIDLDELGEVIDAEACKGGCRFFAEAENSGSSTMLISSSHSSSSPSISATRLIVKT